MPAQPKLQPIYMCPTCNRPWGGNAVIIQPSYFQCSYCSYQKKQKVNKNKKDKLRNGL